MPQTSEIFDTQVKVSCHYLLQLPTNYDSEKSWPLMLFLHGAGERGDDLELVKKHGPPKLIEQGREFPCIVVSPQCPNGMWWDSRMLAGLLDTLEAQFNVDPDRIYVTGMSMGGYGTWRLAVENQNRFAAIAPVCGGGIPRLTKEITHLPTWVFHGAKDSVVPLSESQNMVDVLTEYGGDVKFTVYPEANHDSWTETYENDELYEWMFSQRRM